MAEQTIDDKAKDAPKQDDKKKVKGAFTSGLEEIVEGGNKLGRGVAAISLPVLADQIMGGFDAMATAGAFYAAERKTPVRLSALGTAFAAFAKYTLAPIAKLDFYSRAIATAAWNLGATGLYLGAKKLLFRESFTGYWKELKEKSKKVMKYLYLPTLLSTYAHPLLVVPLIAAQSYIFKRFIDKDKSEKTEEKSKTPLYAAFGNVAKKTVYGTGQATYAIGSALFEKLDKWFAPLKAPAAGPAPAPAKG